MNTPTSRLPALLLVASGLAISGCTQGATPAGAAGVAGAAGAISRIPAPPSSQSSIPVRRAIPVNQPGPSVRPPSANGPATPRANSVGGPSSSGSGPTFTNFGPNPFDQPITLFGDDRVPGNFWPPAQPTGSAPAAPAPGPAATPYLPSLDPNAPNPFNAPIDLYGSNRLPTFSSPPASESLPAVDGPG